MEPGTVICDVVLLPSMFGSECRVLTLPPRSAASGIVPAYNWVRVPILGGYSAKDYDMQSAEKSAGSGWSAHRDVSLNKALMLPKICLQVAGM